MIRNVESIGIADVIAETTSVFVATIFDEAQVQSVVYVRKKEIAGQNS
ncbi:MAG: hypothetical protein MJ000_11125 [Bacteroidales bacterium]|nr:hypothetical protein [Bacteroidales bacterium]